MHVDCGMNLSSEPLLLRLSATLASMLGRIGGPDSSRVAQCQILYMALVKCSKAKYSPLCDFGSSRQRVGQLLGLIGLTSVDGCANSVTMNLLEQTFWGNMWKYTMGKSQLPSLIGVTSVDRCAVSRYLFSTVDMCIPSVSICLWLISLLLFIVHSPGICLHTEHHCSALLTQMHT